VENERIVAAEFHSISGIFFWFSFERKRTRKTKEKEKRIMGIDIRENVGTRFPQFHATIDSLVVPPAVHLIKLERNAFTFVVCNNVVNGLLVALSAFPQVRRKEKRTN
jgi:hypothetical protein